jgi:hypothetical protein
MDEDLVIIMRNYLQGVALNLHLKHIVDIYFKCMDLLMIDSKLLSMIQCRLQNSIKRDIAINI